MQSNAPAAAIRVSAAEKLLDMSKWAIRRLIRAGVADTVQYPEGRRLKRDWVDRVAHEGLTKDEMRRMSDYNRQVRSRSGEEAAR